MRSGSCGLSGTPILVHSEHGRDIPISKARGMLGVKGPPRADLFSCPLNNGAFLTPEPPLSIVKESLVGFPDLQRMGSKAN